MEISKSKIYILKIYVITLCEGDGGEYIYINTGPFNTYTISW